MYSVKLFRFQKKNGVKDGATVCNVSSSEIVCMQFKYENTTAKGYL